MPLKDDIKEITSPSKYIGGFLAFVIMIYQTKSEHTNVLYLLLILTIPFYFIFRWLFVYRYEKKEENGMD